MAEDSNSTRGRLLESACMVFSEKGYHRATIADICSAAGANIALVNYYFGDKATLYDAVWRYAFECATREFPMDAGVTDDDTPEIHLRACIRALLQRVFSTGCSGFFARLMVQEMANPTLTLEHIVDEAIRPQADHICKVLSQLLGVENVDGRVMSECMLSIMGQCLIFGFNRPVRNRLLGERDFSEKDVETLTDHVTAFSLAGLRAARDRATGVGS